ncbi:MAG TPA: hypothetical protein DCG12_12485 [Planctomycetaceae bacterium]|nr:hypothetical protein [Planctomycetaceae bacterium]
MIGHHELRIFAASGSADGVLPPALHPVRQTSESNSADRAEYSRSIQLSESLRHATWQESPKLRWRQSLSAYSGGLVPDRPLSRFLRNPNFVPPGRTAPMVQPV